jgi:transposase-like protein
MIAANSDINGTNAAAGKVEVLYKANMTMIVTDDSYIHSLPSQDYKTPTINPSVNNAVEGDRILSTQTTNATVTLQNGGQRANENHPNSLTAKDSNRQSHN